MSRRPEIELPKDCYCPITLNLMKDPVIASDGHNYERSAIERWLIEHRTSPLTREPIHDNSALISNRALKNVIDVLVAEIKRRELAEDRLAQAEDDLKKVLADLSNDELVIVPVKIEGVIASFHSVGLFAAATPLFDSEKLQELLTHISLGHQDEAEGIIKDNPALLKHATRITDHVDRELTLTPFQLALFYRDWHMWQMIRQYMDPIDQLGQLQGLEEQGTPHGTHYDFSDLNNAYKIYIDLYEALVQSKNWDELNTLWFGVGSAQARAPCHVLQEFFRSDRSFRLPPSFDETEGPLPRSMKLLNGTDFYNSGNISFGSFLNLGVDFTFARSSFPKVAYLGISMFALPHAQTDYLAVAKLCETRSLQYEHLKADLLQAHATPSFS